MTAVAVSGQVAGDPTWVSWLISVIAYVLVGGVLTAAFSQEHVLYGRWVNRRRTNEAQVAGFILTTFVWLPLVVVLSVLPVWRGIKFLGRGFRDLMPERKAKLPKARVV